MWRSLKTNQEHNQEQEQYLDKKHDSITQVTIHMQHQDQDQHQDQYQNQEQGFSQKYALLQEQIQILHIDNAKLFFQEYIKSLTNN